MFLFFFIHLPVLFALFLCTYSSIVLTEMQVLLRSRVMCSNKKKKKKQKKQKSIVANRVWLSIVYCFEPFFLIMLCACFVDILDCLAHSYGREAVRVQHMRSRLPPAGQPDAPQAHAHHHQALLVQQVRQVVQPRLQPARAHQDPLGWQTVRVCGVRRQLLPQGRPQNARHHSHKCVTSHFTSFA